MVVNVMKLIYNLFKANLKAIIEFRLDFLISTIVMVIENFILFTSYIFLNKKVFSVDYSYTITGFALMMFSYVLLAFSRYFISFSELIVKGELDKLLIRPKPLLLKVYFYKINPFIIGEFITFLLLFILSNKKLFFAFLIPTLVLEFSVILFLNSIHFFIKTNESLNLIAAYWNTTYIPLDKHQILKIISFYILPGNLVTFAPYYIEKGILSIKTYLLVVILFFIMAIVTYKLGLRRYESVGY